MPLPGRAPGRCCPPRPSPPQPPPRRWVLPAGPGSGRQEPVVPGSVGVPGAGGAVAAAWQCCSGEPGPRLSLHQARSQGCCGSSERPGSHMALLACPYRGSTGTRPWHPAPLCALERGRLGQQAGWPHQPPALLPGQVPRGPFPQAGGWENHAQELWEPGGKNWEQQPVCDLGVEFAARTPPGSVDHADSSHGHSGCVREPSAAPRPAGTLLWGSSSPSQRCGAVAATASMGSPTATLEFPSSPLTQSCSSSSFPINVGRRCAPWAGCPKGWGAPVRLLMLL